MADELDNLEKQRLTPSDSNLSDESIPMSGADPWVIKPLEEVITRLNFALSSTLLYPAGHPVVNEATEKIHQILQSLLESCSSIPLMFQDEEVIYHGELLLESSFLSRQLSGLFKERGIGYIIFLPGISSEEIRTLIYSFRQTSQGNIPLIETLSQILEDKNVTHLRLGRPGRGKPAKSRIQASRFDIAKNVYTTGTGLIESVALRAVSQRVIDVGQVRPVVQDLMDTLNEDRSALLAVSSLKSFDNYLFTHSMNVCILSLSLSMFINLEPSRVMEIGIGALLHDIGKVFVPTEIIHKPAKLTEAEWQVIRRHPVDGAKMILRSKYATELPAMIVYCHHWKYALEDGYPPTRRKFKRNPFVSLVSICDCYDAMTTNRPYNRIHLPSDALAIIKRLAGTNLDPQLVGFFEKMLGPYPIGTLVKLQSGEIGIVLQTNPDDIDKPQIKLILDQNGVRIEDIVLVDLAEKDESTNEYLNTIAQIVDPTTVSFNVWEYL